eukprot:GFUD01035648.1.p1 GENE.GFUD01035648.1~~GFUD01035648.1.p1  ORF type:complete len:409 (-),score=59.55 GFUD01035648.1:65-1291(-)
MILYLCFLSVIFSFGLSQELLVDADDAPLYPADHTTTLYSEPSEECESKKVLGSLQPAEKELLVNLHNTNRRRIGAAKNRVESMTPLVWNEELAKTAQLWVDQCTLGHDKLRWLLWQGAKLDVGQYVYLGYSRVQDNVNEYNVDLVEEITEELVEDGLSWLDELIGIDGEDIPADSELSRDVLPDMITRAVDNWFTETSQEGRDYISIESLSYLVSDGSYCPQLKYSKTSDIGCGLTAYQEVENPGWLYTLIVCNYAVVQPGDTTDDDTIVEGAPNPSADMLLGSALSRGFISLWEGNRATQDLVCRLRFSRSHSWNLKDTSKCDNDETRSFRIIRADKGTVLRFFDNQYGATSDDWVEYTVKRKIEEKRIVTIPTYEESFENEFLKAKYHPHNGLDGKVSRVEVKLP